MDQDNTKSVTAVPSATVVLLREGETAPEILMVRRRSGDAFGDSYTFPGGIVDDDECEAQAYCSGRTAAQADRILGLDDGGLDFYSAAVRELFEEMGILLAHDAQGAWAFANEEDAQTSVGELRAQLNDGVVSWTEALRQHDLRIACDALHYFSFWETPLSLPKRWAARFFLAAAPPGQDARHDGNEITDSRWMTAMDVLSVGKERGMTLPFPTRTNLEVLSGFASVDDLTRWAASRADAGVDKIRPVILKDGDSRRFVIPGNPDYPQDGN